MQSQLDPAAVDVWAEFLALRESEAGERLDETSRDILFAVCAGQRRSAKVTGRKIILELKRSATYSVILKHIARLVDGRWLDSATDPDDRRRITYTLTPKALGFINLCSRIIRNHAAHEQPGATYARADF